jgi:hypothetical protein
MLWYRYQYPWYRYQAFKNSNFVKGYRYPQPWYRYLTNWSQNFKVVSIPLTKVSIPSDLFPRLVYRYRYPWPRYRYPSDYFPGWSIGIDTHFPGIDTQSSKNEKLFFDPLMWCFSLCSYVMLLFTLLCLCKRALGLSLFTCGSFVCSQNPKYVFDTLMTQVDDRHYGVSIGWCVWGYDECGHHDVINERETLMRRMKMWHGVLRKDMPGMARGPHKGYARNDTGPYIRVCPEWHWTYMVCPELDPRT